jgi:TetR/AcrR family transcriptional regulator, transcriptional repressor for nem operon
MTLFVEWARRQFTLLGADEAAASDHAVTFVSIYQGASLLSYALRDPWLMAAQGRRLADWVDTVA